MDCLIKEKVMAINKDKTIPKLTDFPLAFGDQGLRLNSHIIQAIHYLAFPSTPHHPYPIARDSLRRRLNINNDPILGENICL